MSDYTGVFEDKSGDRTRRVQLGVPLYTPFKVSPYKTLSGMSLKPALDGGFVISSEEGPGYERTIRFAGSLDDCLEYLRSAFKPAFEEATS